MSNVSELWQKLWPSVQNGSEEALERLVEEMYRRYRWYAYRTVGRWDEADDLVQTAWWRLWENRRNIHGNPSLWFYTTLRNLCIDYHRKRHRFLRLLGTLRASTTLDVEEGTQGAALDFWKLWNRLKDRLGEQQREVFWLKDILGMEDEEVSELLQVSPSTVRSHLSLARRKLRQLTRRETAGAKGEPDDE